MVVSNWIYELMLLIFIISIIGYFIDFIESNPKVNKVSFYLLSFVWGMQSSIFLSRLIREKTIPIHNIPDGLFFYAWLLVIISLIANYVLQVRFTVLFANVFSFFILLLSISLQASTSMYRQASDFIHEILMIHIILALISYVFFTLSFIFTIMYLVQYYMLKKKKGFRFIWRFNDLHKLDRYAFYSIGIGVPLLAIGLIFGLVWAYVADAPFYWFDMKTIGSIILLIIYIYILKLRLWRGYRGIPVSNVNVGAFLFMLINFFLLGSLSDFHL